MLLASILINPANEARGIYIPPLIRQNIESFRQWHPGLPHKLFSLQDVLELLEDRFPPYVLDAFNALRPYAYKADLARYCILYEHGGIYADLSYFFTASIPVEEKRAVVFRDFLWSSPWDTSVGLISSPPRHKALERAIELVCDNVKRGYYGPTSLCPTGPALFGKALAMACGAEDLVTGTALQIDRDSIRRHVPDLDLPDSEGVHCLTLGDSLMAIKRKRMASPGLTDFGMNNGNAYAELWEQRRIYVDPGPDAAEEAVPAGTGAEEGTGEGLRARQGAAFPIPKIIHQTWKDADVPARYLEWQESWRALNPGYEYRLWSDNDLEALVRDRYPELLELFLSYASHICRVDLGRYLVLNSFGGVYADLDCECLRPLDGLLESREFVIGCEPQEHLALAKAAASGLSRILCPTFIASIPGHLFWDHLLGRLQEARDHEDVLDSTGPFVLTRAYESFASPSSLSVLPPSELYPVDRERCDSGQVFDLEYWEAATRDAYAIHYWDGSWWRDGSELASGIQTSCGINVVGPASPSPQGPGRPRVSCLMVVTDEDALAETSLSGFLAQTYPDKELVLIDATGSAPAWIDEAARQEGVKVLRLPRQARGAPAWTDPAWTDLALRQARGDYLCIWDADALHDPVRLEYQLAALAVGADASVIGTSIRLELDRRRLSIGAFEPWQTSFFCRRAVFAGTLARLCLNSASLEEIVNDLSVAEIDLPRLFARIGSWEDRKLSPFARNSYSGTRYGAVARELAKRLPIGQLLAREDGRPPAKHRSSYRRQTATG